MSYILHSHRSFRASCNDSDFFLKMSDTNSDKVPKLDVIPKEILELIFCFLDRSAIYACRCVDTQFKTLITPSIFYLKELKRIRTYYMNITLMETTGLLRYTKYGKFNYSMETFNRLLELANFETVSYYVNQYLNTIHLSEKSILKHLILPVIKNDPVIDCSTRLSSET